MSTQLKIKAKSLAAEARIIRSEERRITGPVREERALHRAKSTLRRDPRAGKHAEARPGTNRPQAALLAGYTDAQQARLEKRAARARGRYATLHSLQAHRTEDVRREARATHLARGYLAGRALVEIEQTNHPDRRGPDWARVEAMVRKYGPPSSDRVNLTLDVWREEGAEAQKNGALREARAA